MGKLDEVVIEKKAYEVIINMMKLIELEFLKENNNLDEWVTSVEACQIMKITISAIRYYRESGQLSFSMLGHKYYYKKSDLEEWIMKIKN